MPYTPPAYNAVDFAFPSGGYTAPAYDAVNFSFEPTTSDVAQFTVTTGSALNIVAGFTATFSGATSFVPETAERPFAAATGSSFTAVTDLRTFDISGSSSFIGRYGAIMYCSGASSFSPWLELPMYAQFACPAASLLGAFGASSINSAYTSIGRSRLYPGRGYIQGLAFSGKSKSEATFASGAILSAAFSGQSVCGGAFKGTGVQSRAFSSGGESSLLPAYTKIVSSVFSGASDTLLSGHGVTAKVADMVSYSYSSSDFRTSFSYVAIPKPLDEPSIVFSRTSTQNITVRTA